MEEAIKEAYRHRDNLSARYDNFAGHHGHNRHGDYMRAIDTQINAMIEASKCVCYAPYSPRKSIWVREANNGK